MLALHGIIRGGSAGASLAGERLAAPRAFGAQPDCAWGHTTGSRASQQPLAVRSLRGLATGVAASAGPAAVVRMRVRSPAACRRGRAAAVGLGRILRRLLRR